MINCPPSQIACEQNHWNMTFKADLCWHFHYISTTLEAFWRARYESGDWNNLCKGVSTSLPSIISRHTEDNKRWRYISTHLLHNQFPILRPFCTWNLMVTDGIVQVIQECQLPRQRWASLQLLSISEQIFMAKHLTMMLLLIRIAVSSRWDAEEAVCGHSVCRRLKIRHLGWTHGRGGPLRSQGHLGAAVKVQTR